MVVGGIFIAAVGTEGVIDLDGFAVDHFVRRECRAVAARSAALDAEIGVADDGPSPVAFKCRLGNDDACRHLVLALDLLRSGQMCIYELLHVRRRHMWLRLVPRRGVMVRRWLCHGQPFLVQNGVQHATRVCRGQSAV